MSRTSANITETEKATYTEFCSSHHILDDESPAGIQNGEHIGGYIALWDVDITEETLKVALEKLSDRLVFIPAEQTEVADILLHLDQGQRDIVANWLFHHGWRVGDTKNKPRPNFTGAAKYSTPVIYGTSRVL